MSIQLKPDEALEALQNFAGICVPLNPAYRDQPMPEAIMDYDTPSEWEGIASAESLPLRAWAFCAARDGDTLQGTVNADCEDAAREKAYEVCALYFGLTDLDEVGGELDGFELEPSQ